MCRWVGDSMLTSQPRRRCDWEAQPLQVSLESPESVCACIFHHVLPLPGLWEACGGATVPDARLFLPAVRGQTLTCRAVRSPSVNWGVFWKAAWLHSLMREPMEKHTRADNTARPLVRTLSEEAIRNMGENA